MNLITRKEFSERTGYHLSTVSNYISKGLIVEIDGLIPETEIDRYESDKRTVGPALCKIDIMETRKEMRRIVNILNNTGKNKNEDIDAQFVLYCGHLFGHSPYYIHRISGVRLEKVKKYAQNLIKEGIWEGATNKEARWIDAMNQIREGKHLTNKEETQAKIDLAASALAAQGSVTRIENEEYFCVKCGSENKNMGWLCAKCSELKLAIYPASEIKYNRSYRQTYWCISNGNKKITNQAKSVSQLDLSPRQTLGEPIDKTLRRFHKKSEKIVAA